MEPFRHTLQASNVLSQECKLLPCIYLFPRAENFCRHCCVARSRSRATSHAFLNNLHAVLSRTRPSPRCWARESAFAMPGHVRVMLKNSRPSAAHRYPGPVTSVNKRRAKRRSVGRARENVRRRSRAARYSTLSIASALSCKCGSTRLSAASGLSSPISMLVLSAATTSPLRFLSGTAMPRTPTCNCCSMSA